MVMDAHGMKTTIPRVPVGEIVVMLDKEQRMKLAVSAAEVIRMDLIPPLVDHQVHLCCQAL